MGKGRFRVGSDTFLVLNQGQHYEIEIDSPQKVQSFCVFFHPGLAADVWRCRTEDVPALLDEPYAKADVDFIERTYSHDQSVTPALERVRSAHDGGAPDEVIEERLFELVDSMMSLRLVGIQEARRLSALRATTRDELYRRLHTARDYMRACCEHPLTLRDSAAIACMSPSHFLRSFRELFGCTPHQYLTHQRVERARVLLRTEMPVTQLCFRLGFTSPGSFSNLFRRHVGMSPKQYRDQTPP